MRLKPIKYKNNWLLPDGRRFLNFCDAEKELQQDNCVKVVFMDEINVILRAANRRGYVLFKDRQKLLICVYYCLCYKDRLYKIKQIEKAL